MSDQTIRSDRKIKVRGGKKRRGETRIYETLGERRVSTEPSVPVTPDVVFRGWVTTRLVERRDTRRKVNSAEQKASNGGERVRLRGRIGGRIGGWGGGFGLLLFARQKKKSKKRSRRKNHILIEMPGPPVKKRARENSWLALCW